MIPHLIFNFEKSKRKDCVENILFDYVDGGYTLENTVTMCNSAHSLTGT